MQNRRKNILIDKPAQLRIARRMMLNWIVGGLLILAVPIVLNMCCGLFLAQMSPWSLLKNLLSSIAFPLLAAIVVIPIGIRCSIRLSHRIAGPMFRLKREMKNLINGLDGQPIRLRKGDYFVDVADTFNELLAEHQLLKRRYQDLLETADNFDVDSSSLLLSTYGDKTVNTSSESVT